MIPPTHHARRRAEFLARIDTPVLLFAGGWVARNYPANWWPFRADSTFLFFFPDPEPNAAALFDPADGSVTLYLDERTPEDALWHGSVPGFAEVKARVGVSAIEPRAGLEAHVRQKLVRRKLRCLALHDPQETALAARLSGEDLAYDDPARVAAPELVAAIAALRLRRSPEELAEMRATAQVTHAAHLAAMAATRPGVLEQQLVGEVEGAFARHGCVPAYNTILSVRGEVLHNHRHDQTLAEGDLVLLDAGAENASGYCSDVTRTWPATGRFTGAAAEVYDVVLAAEKAAIEAVRPGARYRDLHLLAARTIAEGLGQMGILKGSPESLVESGAHALFFPHGVGHLLGIDVHDMEAFGDQVHYARGRTRSPQFGTAYLRLDLDLEPGMCFTIEPGVYFVPAILHNAEFRQRFSAQVDFARAQSFLAANSGRGFGGIRIEDDVHCTADCAEVLTAAIPKERADVEASVGG